MNRYKLDILGISETRWTENRKSKTSDDTVILHSVHKDKHIHGVVLMISKKIKVNTLMEWKPISERLLRARFNSEYYWCYSPANEADEETKDEWYEQLQDF